jgi:hypothetical protein
MKTVDPSLMAITRKQKQKPSRHFNMRRKEPNPNNLKNNEEKRRKYNQPVTKNMRVWLLIKPRLHCQLLR